MSEAEHTKERQLLEHALAAIAAVYSAFGAPGDHGYLRSLEARGALLGSRVWIDEELNTEATLKAGQLFIDFDLEPPAPLERLTFRAHRNGDYYEELIAAVGSTQE